MQQMQVSELKIISGRKLKEISMPTTIYKIDEPVAVLLPYKTYLTWQHLVGKRI